MGKDRLSGLTLDEELLALALILASQNFHRTPEDVQRLRVGPHRQDFYFDGVMSHRLSGTSPLVGLPYDKPLPRY